MPSSIPSLAEMVGPYDEMLERLADLTPIWSAVQQAFNTIKDREFRAGIGPDGPHRPLKPSSRRGHRTGVPLNNSGHLRRSFSDEGHVHYHWNEDEVGWEHRSSHPALPHLRRMGYSVEGLSPEHWKALDDIVRHYLNTGEILSS